MFDLASDVAAYLAKLATYASSEDVADYLMMKSYIEREPTAPNLVVTMKDIDALLASHASR